MFNILKKKDRKPEENKEWQKIEKQNDDLFNIALAITEGKATA